MANDRKRVEALLEERRGLVQRGLDERVAQVDEEIRAYGGEPPAEEAKGPAEERSQAGQEAAPRGRRGKQQATGDQSGKEVS